MEMSLGLVNLELGYPKMTTVARMSALPAALDTATIDSKLSDDGDRDSDEDSSFERLWM